MNTLAVINSDPKITRLISDIFQEGSVQQYNPVFLTNQNEVWDFLDYNLPELALINFADPNINIEEIANFIQNDQCFLDFGIIGIFSGEKEKEVSYLQKYKSINILIMLDTNLLKSHLVKIIKIIEENYHIIRQREFSRGILDGSSGSFIIKNDILSIPLYAGIPSTILAQRGLLNPENKMHLQLALGELIINAIEHGNCGITHEEKSEALAKGISAVDMIAERCKNPEIRKKKVELLWDIQSDKTSFVISDEGNGFDVKSYIKKFSEHDKMKQHGLGIKMASMLATKLLYNKKGNVVTLILKHDDSVEHEVPVGFSQEQVHNFNVGDIVLRENEPSDYLYYIISGSYSVYHKSRKVGVLSPQDIFMGEIAFLLNQPRSATVKADKPGKLVSISKKALVDIIRKYPHYCFFLSRLLARRLVRANVHNTIEC